ARRIERLRDRRSTADRRCPLSSACAEVDLEDDVADDPQLADGDAVGECGAHDWPPIGWLERITSCGSTAALIRRSRWSACYGSNRRASSRRSTKFMYVWRAVHGPRAASSFSLSASTFAFASGVGAMP